MILKLAGKDIFVLDHHKIHKSLFKLNFMALEQEILEKSDIDLDFLKKFSSPTRASKLFYCFERYFGKIPTNRDFFKIYLRVAKYKEEYEVVFNVNGDLRKIICEDFNFFPRFRFTHLRLIENYLFEKKFINEKIFEQA